MYKERKGICLLHISKNILRDTDFKVTVKQKSEFYLHNVTYILSETELCVAGFSYDSSGLIRSLKSWCSLMESHQITPNHIL